MISFLPFITLALATMVVASPLGHGPSPVVSLSAGVVSINLIDESGHVGPVENFLSSRELGMDDDSETSATMACTDGSKSKFIWGSLWEAKTLANIAVDYIRTHGTDDSLFKDYFGAINSSYPQWRVFTDATNKDSVSLNCRRCAGDDIAYANRTASSIYYCPAFYNQDPTSKLCSGETVASRSTRGGTTLHELTRVVSATAEHRVGCSDARKLASINPELASQNADNYNCFATQVYANTQC